MRCGRCCAYSCLQVLTEWVSLVRHANCYPAVPLLLLPPAPLPHTHVHHDASPPITPHPPHPFAPLQEVAPVLEDYWARL